MLALEPQNATLAQSHQQPKLLDRLRASLRVKHYALATERTYVHWVKRFIFFHGKRHPADVSTTMIYTHVLNRGGRGVVSPLDRVAA